MSAPLSICWFRQDLRLADNPALVAAAAHGRILPVFILDDDSAGADRMGAASRWWLHHSLVDLNAALGGKLHVARGDARDILPALAAQAGADSVFWNRAYEPWRIARDTDVKARLSAAGVTAAAAATRWDDATARCVHSHLLHGLLHFRIAP